MRASFLSTCLTKTVQIIGTGVNVYSRMPDVWENMRVCLCSLPGTQSSCRNILTVPFIDPRSPFIAPMTKRSILQHQRCRPTFVWANNQEESEVGGLDDARNDHSMPLYLPLSPTFSVYKSRCSQSGSETAADFCHSHQNSIIDLFSTCRCAAVPGSPPHDKQNICSLKAEEEKGGWCIGVCRRVTLLIIHNPPVSLHFGTRSCSL